MKLNLLLEMNGMLEICLTTSRPSWILNLKNNASTLNIDGGVIYTGNPKILKEICPGVFGTIKPVGYCMIGQK